MHHITFWFFHICLGIHWKRLGTCERKTTASGKISQITLFHTRLAEGTSLRGKILLPRWSKLSPHFNKGGNEGKSMFVSKVSLSSAFLFQRFWLQWAPKQLFRFQCVYLYVYHEQNTKNKWTPTRETLSLGPPNNKNAYQPAHPRCLISAFVICLLESIISKLATSEIRIL